MAKRFDHMQCLCTLEQFTRKEQKAYNVMTFGELPEDGKTYKDYVADYSKVATTLELKTTLFRSWSKYMDQEVLIANLEVALNSNFEIYVSPMGDDESWTRGDIEIRNLLTGPYQLDAKQARKDAMIDLLGKPDTDRNNHMLWKKIVII